MDFDTPSLGGVVKAVFLPYLVSSQNNFVVFFFYFLSFLNLF